MSNPPAPQPARWHRHRRLLALAIGLLLVLAAAALRPLWLTLFLFPDLVQVGPRPLVWTSLSPQRTTIQLPYASDERVATADLYVPRGGVLDWRSLARARRPAVVLFVGIDTPRDYPPLARLADGLARAGAVVLVPETPTMLANRFDAREADSLVVAFEYLARLPLVNPQRIGFSGFSIGGSVALLAAAHPRIRDRLAYVHAFGAYADATTLLTAVATQRIPATGAGWLPDPKTRVVLRQMLLDWVPSPHDRETLRAVLPQPGRAPGISACPPLASAEAQLACALELAPARAAPLLRDLPATTRRRIDALSPAAMAGDIHAPVLLMHDRDDTFIPYTESRALAAALTEAGNPPVRFSEFGLFSHVLPGRPLPPRQMIAEVWRLLRHAYHLFGYMLV